MSKDILVSMTTTEDPVKTSLLTARTEFSKARIWPMQPMEIDPSGWLENFAPEDRHVAVALLDTFMFFNGEMTKTLLESALASLAAQPEYSDSPHKWESFLRRALITFPTGETPSPTDSGYMFVRIARQQFGFPESQIVDPQGAVVKVDASQEPVPVIFVDDIVGSGDQLIETWCRDYPLREGGFTSLNDQWEGGEIESVHVVAPIVTWAANQRLTEDYPYFGIGKAHILGPEYSAKNSRTVLVPEELRTDLTRVITKYSPKCGFSGKDAFGHNELALNIAFEHSFPDLSLPLLWSESSDWKPLRKRS